MEEEIGIVGGAFRHILDRYGNEPPSLRHLDFERHRRFPSLRVFFGNGDDHHIALPHYVGHLPEPERRAFRARCLDRCRGLVEDRRRGREAPSDDLARAARDPFGETRERWRSEAFADPEIGGADGWRAMERVRDLIGNYTNGHERAELLSLFEETGLGDNPTFLRFLHRLARRQEEELRRVELMVRPPLIAPAFERGEIAPSPGAFELANWRRATEVAERARLHEREQREMEEGIEGVHRDMMDAMLYGLGPATAAMRGSQPWPAIARDAADRGMTLLRSWLTPDQLAQFEREHQFDVVGSSGQRRYRIFEGSVQNVFELDDRGSIRRGLCFAPVGGLVAGDVMLAQKIALETDEEAVRQVANPFGQYDFLTGLVDMAPGAVSRIRTSLPAATWRRMRDFF